MNIVELMDMMNYNLSRENGKSMLGEIQKKIIDLEFSNPNINKEQMDRFEANLFSNPSMFSSKINYSGIRDVNMYFDVKKKEFLNSKQLEGNKTL